MVQFSAHFDGKYICPDEPVSLPEDVPLRVSVDDQESVADGPRTRPELFERLESEAGLVEGPKDWAAEHDHYLFGAPKQSDG